MPCPTRLESLFYLLIVYFHNSGWRQQLNGTNQSASGDILFTFYLYADLFNLLTTNSDFKAKVEPTVAALFHLCVKSISVSSALKK